MGIGRYIPYNDQHVYVKKNQAARPPYGSDSLFDKLKKAYEQVVEGHLQ